MGAIRRLISGGFLMGSMIAVASASVGCSRPRQPEIVTSGDATRRTGRALIVLPRICVIENEVSARHMSSNRTSTTIDVQRVLDRALVGSSAVTHLATARTNTTAASGCERTGDDATTRSTSAARSAASADLASLYASRDALKEMRDRGADHLLVIELRAAFGCVYGGGAALVAHYGSIGMGSLSAETTANRCQEEDITLTAYLFEADGRARWTASRAIDPGTTNIEPLIDRFLAKIPVAIPGYRFRGELDPRPCHLDDRGRADCT